ncbi:MAG: DUF1043 family protein, partial [Gammaproteobacteria bacterium]|nr:DUF1043 family protein [Gammaproteobacteria bacterium]
QRGEKMVTLDGTSSMWVVGILGLLLGLALGSIVTHALLSRNSRTHKLQRELNQLNERFTDYRDQVSQHFMHTSDLVKEMTRSYRDVYEHLATGAYHLCTDETESPTLRHQTQEQIAAENTPDTTATDADYDELEELSSLKDDIDSLLGESPRISDLDIKFETTGDKPAQH